MEVCDGGNTENKGLDSVCREWEDLMAVEESQVRRSGGDWLEWGRIGGPEHSGWVLQGAFCQWSLL